MLIRWADEDRYESLEAIDRRTEARLGLLTFSREAGEIMSVSASHPEAERRLRMVAERQMHPQGGSFHYSYPRYAKQSQPAHCPPCQSLPMPEGHIDIAETEYTWATGEYPGQGRLFGKLVVGAKRHYVHFEDMPEDGMIGFMRDVQRVGAALRKVTGAVKINFEMHANSGPHLHIHLFPRYLDDDFPSAPIDYRVTEPAPYEDYEEYLWFIERMREELQ